MHAWDIRSSAAGRKPAWQSKLLQARASDSPAEHDSWQSFLACKRARRRIARRLDLGEALNERDTEQLDWSPVSHSQNTSSSSEQRPNSLPNRQVSEQFLPGLDSLSDDGRFSYYSPVSGADLQLMSADRLQAANAAVRQRLMDQAWEAAKQREADSMQELARSAPAGLYHMERLSGGGEQPGHQPRGTHSAPSSMSNNDSGRHSFSLPLAARRGVGEGYSDSRDQSGKDSGSVRDFGRASIGLLDRIQETNSEASDMKSGVSASSKLQRRSFDLASVLGLMSAATSKGEGQDETEIKGYLDSAESAQSGPSQHFSGSSGDNVMRSADEPSLFSLNHRVLTGSETGSASTARHHRLDSMTSLDSLRRAAANMLANLLETPQEVGGSERAEEDVSGLDTPEFCTPSPSPFKGAAVQFPVAAETGEMQPRGTDAGAGSGAPLTQPVGGTEDHKAIPAEDRREITDSAASVADRAQQPDSQTASATENETAAISPRDMHDTRASEALMTLSYLVASEAQQNPVGKDPAPEASSASASAGRNSTASSFAFDTDTRQPARTRAFVPPVPVMPPISRQTSSASASPSTMATPTRPLFPLDPGPWTDPSSSEISPRRSPASARKPKPSYAAATNDAAPALAAAAFTAGSAMPKSQGQQQGSASSEATQRRSLLRRLSSKAVQLCSPKARRTEHGSGSSPRASLEQARGEAQRQSVEAARFLTPRASYTVTVDGWPASPGSSPARVRASPALAAPNASPPRPLSALPLWGILGLGSGPGKSRPSSVESSRLSSSRPVSRAASGEYSRRSSMDLPALSHSAVFRKVPVAGLENAAVDPASNLDQASSLSPQASGGSKRFLRAGSGGSPIPTIIEEEKTAPSAPGKPEDAGARLHPRRDLSPEKPAPGSSGDLADYLSTYAEAISGPRPRSSWLGGGYGSAAVDVGSWRDLPPADNMLEGKTSTDTANPFAAERFGRPVGSSGASAEIQPDEPMEYLAGDAIRPETPSRMELGTPFAAVQDGSMTVRTGKEARPAQKTQAKRKVTVDAGEAGGAGSLGVLVMEDSSNQYEGQVGSSGMHGLGVLRFEGGSSYAGQWAYSVYQGAGIETFSNGSYYVGQFHNGTHHGSGVCHYTDNTTYSGQWHAGLQHGLGCQDATDGEAFFYVGSFNRGLRQGLGVAIFANGEEFFGELAADAPHGYGVARLGSKKGVYEGQWAHGMRHGWAVSTLPNNSMWAGQWVFGKACWLAELYLLGDGELPDQYLEAMDLCDEAARLARAAGLAANAQAKSIRLPGGNIQVAIHNASKEACTAAREAHVYRQKAQILCGSSHGAESSTMSQH